MRRNDVGKISMLCILCITLSLLYAASVQAAEYKNASLGFSLTYPGWWQQKEASDPKVIVFYASPVIDLPWISVSIVEGESFQKALDAAATSWAAQRLSAEPAKEIVTKNGVKGFTSKISYRTGGTGYAAEGFVLGTQKDGKWIIAHAGTCPRWDSYDEGAFSKIVTSLKFN